MAFVITGLHLACPIPSILVLSATSQAVGIILSASRHNRLCSRLPIFWQYHPDYLFATHPYLKEQNMSTNVAPAYDDEIDIKTLMIPSWRSKTWITAVGFILAALVMVFQIGSFVLDRSQSASIQVHFNFEGASEGKFPNNSQFSPQQMLSGSVISELFKKLNTEDFTSAELADAIRITPSIHGSDLLETVIIDLVSKNKGLSTNDFSAAVNEYSSALTNQSKTNVILAMDLSFVNGNKDRAAYILTEIPKIWATQALEIRGVFTTTIPPISQLNNGMMSDELLVQVNILADTHILLSDHVELMIRDTGNSAIKDPSTGLSLPDLAHKLELEEKYRISILKELVVKHGVGVTDNGFYRGFREARLGALKREQAKIQRLVLVYEDAINRFNQYQSQLMSSNQGAKTNGQNSVYAPQYGEDVVNTLLELGSKIADPEYRKELLEKKIVLSTELQKVITEIEFFESSATTTNLVGADNVIKLIGESYESLQSAQKILVDLSSMVNTSRLDEKGQLYDLVNEVTFTTNSNLSKNSMLKVVLAFMLGCIAAAILVLARTMVRSPQLD
jgi:hypothetical protein